MRMLREIPIADKGIGCVAVETIRPGTLILRYLQPPWASRLVFRPEPKTLFFVRDRWRENFRKVEAGTCQNALVSDL